MIIGLTVALTEPFPTHDHELHEFIVCMTESGELHVPGREYSYKTGATLFIPGRVSHGIMLVPPASGIVGSARISTSAFVPKARTPGGVCSNSVGGQRSNLYTRAGTVQENVRVSSNREELERGPEPRAAEIRGG